MKPLLEHSIAELAARIAARQVSAPSSPTRAWTDRARERALNAFITVLADQARDEARRADAERAAGRHRGPLHGIPLSFKDLIDVAGVPPRRRPGCARATSRRRTRPSPRGSARPAPSSSARRTCTSSPSGRRARTPRSGPFTTRDTIRSPGGSSGGSAAAVVAAWASPRSARTPAARSGSPPRRAGSSDSRGRSARCRRRRGAAQPVARSRRPARPDRGRRLAVVPGDGRRPPHPWPPGGDPPRCASACSAPTSGPARRRRRGPVLARDSRLRHAGAHGVDAQSRTPLTRPDVPAPPAGGGVRVPRADARQPPEDYTSRPPAAGDGTLRARPGLRAGVDRRGVLRAKSTRLSTAATR